MSEIMHIDTAKARFNPSTVFARPADVVEAIGLTRGQKIATLERWEREVHEQLAATNEGMPNHGTSTRGAALLDEIRIAIGLLRMQGPAEAAPETPAT